MAEEKTNLFGKLGEALMQGQKKAAEKAEEVKKEAEKVEQKVEQKVEAAKEEVKAAAADLSAKVEEAKPLKKIGYLHEENVEKIAKEVIDGKWGNGAERKAKLEEAGHNYAEVQTKVNELLGCKVEVKAESKLEQIAKEVINGKWGNGAERKAKLEAAGYNYSEVQAKVNELLK